MNSIPAPNRQRITRPLDAEERIAMRRLQNETPTEKIDVEPIIVPLWNVFFMGVTVGVFLGGMIAAVVIYAWLHIQF